MDERMKCVIVVKRINFSTNEEKVSTIDGRLLSWAYQTSNEFGDGSISIHFETFDTGMEIQIDCAINKMCTVQVLPLAENKVEITFRIIENKGKK
jgi:hypothetical protein